MSRAFVQFVLDLLLLAANRANSGRRRLAGPTTGSQIKPVVAINIKIAHNRMAERARNGFRRAITARPFQRRPFWLNRLPRAASRLPGSFASRAARWMNAAPQLDTKRLQIEPDYY